MIAEDRKPLTEVWISIQCEANISKKQNRFQGKKKDV